MGAEWIKNQETYNDEQQNPSISRRRWRTNDSSKIGKRDSLANSGTKWQSCFKNQNQLSMNISNIFKEGELKEELVMSKFGNSEFTMKPTNIYNLDMIISVGYRISSSRGTQFRIWATQRLKEYLIKGFTMNDERLSGGKSDYLEELELKRLELLVEQFLSFAELRSVERKVMYMRDWNKKLDEFLVLNEKEILKNAGKVSRKKYGG